MTKVLAGKGSWTREALLGISPICLWRNSTACVSELFQRERTVTYRWSVPAESYENSDTILICVRLVLSQLWISKRMAYLAPTHIIIIVFIDMLAGGRLRWGACARAPIPRPAAGPGVTQPARSPPTEQEFSTQPPASRCTTSWFSGRGCWECLLHHWNLVNIVKLVTPDIPKFSQRTLLFWTDPRNLLRTITYASEPQRRVWDFCVSLSDLSEL